MELSSRFGVRWTKALPSSFSTADLVETWCRTSARCFHPPPAGGARAAFLTGHEGVFHPHVRFWSAVGFRYSLSRFPPFDHSRRLFTSLTSLLSVAFPPEGPPQCPPASRGDPFLLNIKWKSKPGAYQFFDRGCRRSIFRNSASSLPPLHEKGLAERE